MSGTSSNSVVGQVTGAYNQYVNMITSYNPSNGKFGDSGSGLSWLGEGVGQINGTNAARHALGVAGDAQIAANAQANQLIQQEQQQKQIQDVQASNSAAGFRATAQAQSQAGFLSSTAPIAMGGGQKLGSNTTNYLGAA